MFLIHTVAYKGPFWINVQMSHWNLNYMQHCVKSHTNFIIGLLATQLKQLH